MREEDAPGHSAFVHPCPQSTPGTATIITGKDKYLSLVYDIHSLGMIPAMDQFAGAWLALTIRVHGDTEQRLFMLRLCSLGQAFMFVPYCGDTDHTGRSRRNAGNYLWTPGC